MPVDRWSRHARRSSRCAMAFFASAARPRMSSTFLRFEIPATRAMSHVPPAMSFHHRAPRRGCRLHTARRDRIELPAALIACSQRWSTLAGPKDRNQLLSPDDAPRCTGAAVLRGDRHPDLCQPVLDRFAQECHGSLGWRWSTATRSWVAHARSVGGLVYQPSLTSNTVPLFATASGKAWLATLPPTRQCIS